MRNITTDRDSIFEAQVYLNKLHYTTNGDIPLVNPDGIFASETEEAVKKFQELYGLQVTGEIDLATWNALYESYLLALRDTGIPTPLEVFPNEVGYTIDMGEKSDIVFIVQFILNRLSDIHSEIDKLSESGIYDSETEKDVMEFQKIYTLNVSGRVDRVTWNALANSYNRLSRQTY